MKRYVIERMIPGVGKLTAQQYRDAAAVSNEALAKLAPKVQWVHSYFADDMTYCVYLAENPRTSGAMPNSAASRPTRSPRSM